MAAEGSSLRQGLVIPAEASLLPNQSIVEPATDLHHLSAADDLVGRFLLEDSYHILLHPYRRDLPRHPRKPSLDEGNDGKAQASSPSDPQPASTGTQEKDEDKQAAHTPINLARTYEHFLPPSLPGRVRPMKPPRKKQVMNRRQALQNIAESQQQAQAAGGGGGAGGVSIRNRDRELARKDEEWEKFKQTLRRAVYKPEYTPAEIVPLEEDAMKGFRVQAGEVDEIDRALLEADPPPGSVHPKKKKRKGPGGASAPAAGGSANGGGS